MSSWTDIWKRLDAGAKFDVSGLTVDQLSEIFTHSIDDDVVEAVMQRVRLEADRQQDNRELLATIVQIVSGVTGLAVQARKVV